MTTRPGVTGGRGRFTEFAPEDVTLALHRLTGWALDQQASLDGLEVTRSSLEDLYLALTGTEDGAGTHRPAGQDQGGTA
jgi:hypothetical protein